MAKTRPKPAWFLAAALIILGAHFALNARFADQSESISYGFFLLVSLIAAGASWWNGWQAAPAMRRSWRLFTSALLLWSAATVMAAAAHILHVSPKFAAIDDFFYFFFGVPLLLAIAAPDETQADALFFWFDGIQAVAVGLLAYIELFAVIPFSGAPAHPMPVSRLIWIYDTEHLILAIFATARMAVSPRNTAHRRFFQVLVLFLCTYGTCASVYNHIVARFTDAGLLDIMVDFPFLLLAGIAIFFPMPAHGREEERPTRRPVALYVDNARPTLLGIALVLLSTLVAQHHFRIAMSTILGAFVLYGIRSAMLQTRLINTQMLLETANDRLAEMTLEDGLTGIANRRCFDQRLAQEWSRAQRSHAPLSLLLIDIDHFKNLNDTHGHLIGDECLIQVARALKTVLQRPSDLLARYGGEEFVGLLPETDEMGAQNVAARIQLALGNTEPIQGIDRQVTVSIGVTTWLNQRQISAQQLVDTADRALYAAKQNGRNRIEFLHMAAEPDATFARN